jgi:molybdopterin-containing oxidoreductase family iron-sulfur binding subunit
VETTTQVNESTRREFLRNAGVIAGASALAVTTGVAVFDDPEVAAAATGTPRNDTVRMVQDLQRALTRPMASRRWGMVIDPRRCVGCNACTVACISHNGLPVGVSYRTVPETESGSYPALQRFFMPTNCMQCENAPCIKAANAVINGSMARRADGIVTIDYARMKGRKVFKAAQKACPYEGALYYDAGRSWTTGTPSVQPYDKRGSREYGATWSRAKTRTATRKCHFCTERLDAGLLPACVATCIGQAMHFGDLSDSQSLVAELVAGSTTLRIQKGAATAPRVIYVDDPLTPSGLTCSTCHS